MPLYIREAAVLVLTFRQGLLFSKSDVFWGILWGAALFIVVLPSMRAVRIFAVPWRRAPWTPWEKPPAWTKP